MADFDPESLTWKVFCNVVREKHGHTLTARWSIHVKQWMGQCSACRLDFGPELRMDSGWMIPSSGPTQGWGHESRFERARSCPGKMIPDSVHRSTRPS